MKAIKPILPSLREKKRYVVFEMISDSKIDNPTLVGETIEDSFLDFLGTDGAARAGFMFLPDKFDANKQKGIVKVSNKFVDKLRTSLALIRSIKNQKVIFKTAGVSGILRKAEKKFMAS